MTNYKEIGYRVASLTGWILMMVSLYEIGGLWWMLLVAGFIAWMPIAWIK